jgi:hypothetical protein
MSDTCALLLLLHLRARSPQTLKSHLNLDNSTVTQHSPAQQARLTPTASGTASDQPTTE